MISLTNEPEMDFFYGLFLRGSGRALAEPVKASLIISSGVGGPFALNDLMTTSNGCTLLLQEYLII